MISILNETNINAYLEESHKKPLIIDAYAEWCGPCQQMAPFFEQLAQEMSSNYNFAKLNVDDESELANRYNIRSVPTIIFIKNGITITVKVGFMNKQTLKAEIEKAFQQ